MVLTQRSQLPRSFERQRISAVDITAIHVKLSEKSFRADAHATVSSRNSRAKAQGFAPKRFCLFKSAQCALYKCCIAESCNQESNFEIRILGLIPKNGKSFVHPTFGGFIIPFAVGE